MNKTDYKFLLCLFVLAVFIWLRNTSWMDNTEDTLPILVALPVFVWLGWPWHFRTDNPPVPTKGIAIAVILFVLGIAVNLTLILAIAWTLILWTWLSARVDLTAQPNLNKLLILPIMAFPWIGLDAGQVGWWFRLSGAWATGQFYTLLGLDVRQEGTQLLINNLPISVEVACAGLNTLQSMLIAGAVIAYFFLGTTSRYWWNIPLLVVIAWVANTIRILTISAAGLIFTPEFAMGAFHTWGGWLVLVIMFLMSWILFAIQEPKTPPKSDIKL